MQLTKLAHSEARKYIFALSHKKNHLVSSRTYEENSSSKHQISRVVSRDF